MILSEILNDLVIFFYQHMLHNCIVKFSISQDERDNLHQGSNNIRRSISIRRCSCICCSIVASQDSSDDISEKSSILNSSLRGSRKEEKAGDKTRARHMRTCYSLS